MVEYGDSATLTAIANHAYVAIFTKNSVKPTDKQKTNTTKVNAAKATTKAAVNTKTAAKTGDASPVAGLLFLMAVAGSVPAVLYFKRKNQLDSVALLPYGGHSRFDEGNRCPKISIGT